MADTIFQELKKTLDDFSNCVEKDIEEIRQQKAAIQSMKLEMESLAAGRFITDSQRIVISAPEIIIGNVDRDGVLRGDSPYSHVVIRSNTIDIEGASPVGATSGGSITQRASRISTIAVDPGADGLENYVGLDSSIIQQARSISIMSNDAQDVFTMPDAVPVAGVAIHSDSSVDINAVPSVEGRLNDIEGAKKSLSDAVSPLKSEMSEKKKAVENLIDAMEKCINDQEGLTDDQWICTTSIADIYEKNAQLDGLKQSFCMAVAEYSDVVFRLAEANRQIKALDEAKGAVDKIKGDFKTKTTFAEVSISGETINLTSRDGDGNLRTNDEAAINLQAQTVNVTSLDGKGALMEKGSFTLNTKTINISTADTKKKDEKNIENPAVGDINVVSKNINVAAVDMETKDGKSELKELTKDGKLAVRIENVDVLAADKEGKSTGSVSVNAKAVEIKSMDVDKDKLTDKQLAAGSTMVMVSEKMWQGGKDSKTKSKQYQITGENVAVIAKTTAEVQQDKSIVQLDGGNLSIGGSKTALFGETTVNGKAEFKADLKAGKATIDNVEAKSSFKSTNISDGIAVPAPPSTANLTAKLKEEEAPKKQ
ncbi:MAG: hypothetical protein MJ002_03155 [Paludibacteraceae bacterium]|nr:hypothetical protein [Paludibacteraceae bacterium]